MLASILELSKPHRRLSRSLILLSTETRWSVCDSHVTGKTVANNDVGHGRNQCHAVFAYADIAWPKDFGDIAAGCAHIHLGRLIRMKEPVAFRRVAFESDGDGGILSESARTG